MPAAAPGLHQAGGYRPERGYWPGPARRQLRDRNPSKTSDRDPTARSSRSERPFLDAFSTAARTASGSISRARAREAPSRRAAIDRIAVPQPTSITSIAGDPTGRDSRISSIISRQSWVVGWVPVPKAIPGSIRMGSAPGEGLPARRDDHQPFPDRDGVVVLLPGFCPVIFGNRLELRLGQRADPAEVPERFFQTLAFFFQAFVDRR